MTNGSGTTSTLQIVKTEPVKPLTEDRVCGACGGKARLVEKFGDMWLHLNMSECGTETSL